MNTITTESFVKAAMVAITPELEKFISAAPGSKLEIAGVMTLELQPGGAVVIRQTQTQTTA